MEPVFRNQNIEPSIPFTSLPARIYNIIQDLANPIFSFFAQSTSYVLSPFRVQRDPFEKLPGEAIETIFSFLNPTELYNARAVSKEWMGIIDRHQLQRRRLLRRSLIAEAKRVAQMSLKDEILFRIVALEVKSDPDGANKTARLIQDSYYKALALIELKDLEEARAIVHTIEGSLSKFFVLKEIAVNDPQGTLDEAYQEACQLNDPLEKDHALFSIVREKAKEDPAAAKVIADTIKDQQLKDMALLQVLENLAPLSKEAALRVIEDIRNKDIALVSVVKAEAEKDPRAAIEIAQAIKKTNYKDDALFVMAVALAKTNILAAKEKAHSIKGSLPTLIKFQAFVEIAKLDPSHDTSDAEAILQEITHSDSKIFAHLAIANIHPLHHLKSAKELASGMSDLSSKFHALLKITRVDRSHDTSDVEAILKEIRDSNLKAHSLLSLAEFVHELIEQNS